MRCKPGDLAVVINEDPGFEENIGRIVRVLRLSDFWPHCWIIDEGGRPLLGEDYCGRVTRDGICHVPDRILLPLPGDVTDHDEPAPARVPAGERA